MKETNIQRLIIVALLCLVTFLSLRTCAKKQAEVKKMENVIEVKNDSLHKYKDEAGNNHAQKVLAQADMAVLKTAYFREIDSLTNLLEIKDKQLQAYAGVSTSTEGTVIPRVDTIVIDTANHIVSYPFNYTDKWLSLHGNIGPKSFINYQLTDSIVITTYDKKTGFLGLGKRQTYIDAFSLNPNVRVTGLDGFRVPVKQPGRLGIGPFVGYGFNNGRLAPTAGISIQYSIIRF
jgi:uncharacterized protein YfbU (UPF0304 family)